MNISANSVTPVNGGTPLTDTPINDPAGVLVGKFDGEKTYNGAANLPQGAASLAGAEFTVKYYDGFYDTAEQAEEMCIRDRSWASTEIQAVPRSSSFKCRMDRSSLDTVQTTDGPCPPMAATPLMP